MIKRLLIAYGLTFMVIITGCEDNTSQDVSPNNNKSTFWLIPKNKVFDGGVGRDGIPSIDQPQFIPANEADFLQDDERILGIATPTGSKAYPHKILDWHEIVNDQINAEPVSLIYCPLTGTGTLWSRKLEGTVTTFGVSGLIYKNNVIPYDRSTDSYWSQMGIQSVAGELSSTVPDMLPILETTWGEWKSMYPNTQVLSLETGFSRSYDFNPYFGYRDNNQKISFPVEHEDTRLNRKSLVLGLIYGANATKAYPLTEFGDTVKVIQENLRNRHYVMVGSDARQFAMCFEAKMDGEILRFRPVQDQGAIVLQDTNTGTYWDIMGYATEGPMSGKRLIPTLSFIGYWFAWADFYPGLELYNGDLSGFKEDE